MNTSIVSCLGGLLLATVIAGCVHPGASDQLPNGFSSTQQRYLLQRHRAEAQAFGSIPELPDPSASAPGPVGM